MKQIVLIFALFASSIILRAQSSYFDNSNSVMRIAKVIYERDRNGFYHKKENVNLDKVNVITSFYAYNKKTKELFVKTNNANCIITVNDNMAKFYKKSSSIPQLKGMELEEAISKATEELDAKYIELNELRQKAINDSIERDKREKIRIFREDSIRKEREITEATNYRNSHKWRWVPTGRVSLYCELCKKNVTTADSVLCFAVKNDSIYWVEGKTGYLEQTQLEVHACKVSSSLKTNENFRYHNKIFADSLQFSKPNYSIEDAAYFNYGFLENYLEKVRKLAPHGFFLNWGWNDEYSTITFNFRYMNTNKKTIKYITVYWSVTNDVGDVRKTGHFKGTGPLEQWEAASWDWDYSHYYVAGDATRMNITKVAITYMDGTSISIPKNKLMFN